MDRHFGENGDENSNEETFLKIKKIFDERWGENEADTEAQEVHDFLNDEMLEDIDINIEAMERVTKETEKAVAESEQDPEVREATKLLVTPRRKGKASVPKAQQDVPVHSDPFNATVPSERQGAPRVYVAPPRLPPAQRQKYQSVEEIFKAVNPYPIDKGRPRESLSTPHWSPEATQE
ncbi:hypothetical protein M413DRAFT_6756 [Hebeloma cylindrosporum]|uniref:Uncharacterized protein n=1 Tax=Hebeloma cylindrosporum TaxID=76867 RepID=A0A0C2Z9Y9_HEBCY|nr:hypothetical protein M413DRAFT_6756 [Hebeloma cylindrosporum h7]